MNNAEEIDFEDIKSRIREIKLIMMKGRVHAEQLKQDDAMEGFLLIATKAARTKQQNLIVCDDEITTMGGCVDPIAHALARIMVAQPELFSRLSHWIRIELQAERNTLGHS